MKIFVRRWWMFFLTAAMYGIIGACTAFLSAIGQIDDPSWEKMVSSQFYAHKSFWILSISMLLAALTQVRALMNGDYHKAKDSNATLS